MRSRKPDRRTPRVGVTELLRGRRGATRALHALEACEEVFAAYAAPSAAVQVLTLELRGILRG